MRYRASSFFLVTEAHGEIAADVLLIDSLISIHADPRQTNKHGALNRAWPGSQGLLACQRCPARRRHLAGVVGHISPGP